MQCMPAEHVYVEGMPIESRRRSLGRDVAMQHNAMAPCNTQTMLRRSKTLEKTSIAQRSEPMKALPMQNVLKLSMDWVSLLSTPAMCCCTAGLRKNLTASLFTVFSGTMSLVSSTLSPSTLRSLARSLRMRPVAERFSLASVCLVDESCTFLISSATVFMGTIFTANKILLVNGKISVSVLFVVGSCMFRVHVENVLALRFLNFCFARTSTALNKGT